MGKRITMRERYKFHGGCEGCTQQLIHPVEFCMDCMYFDADWGLPDLNNKRQTRAELKRAELKRAELKRAELKRAELKRAELKKARSDRILQKITSFVFFSLAALVAAAWLVHLINLP